MQHRPETGYEHLQGTASVNHAPESNLLKVSVLLPFFSKKLVRKCLLRIYSRFTEAHLF